MRVLFAPDPLRQSRVNLRAMHATPAGTQRYCCGDDL